MKLDEQHIVEKIYSIVQKGKPKAIIIKGQKHYINKEKIKILKQKFHEEKVESGFLPLLTLLPLIFGGMSAAASTAGIIASKVIDNKKVNADKESKEREIKSLEESKRKELEEQSRHNQELEKLENEKIKRLGGSLNYEDTKQIIKEFVNKLDLNDEYKKSIKNILKTLIDVIEFKSFEGEGIILKPY